MVHPVIIRNGWLQVKQKMYNVDNKAYKLLNQLDNPAKHKNGLGESLLKQNYLLNKTITSYFHARTVTINILEEDYR